MKSQPRHIHIATSLVVALALLTGACMSSQQVDSGDLPATPLPTRAPVFIPTTAPAPTSIESPTAVVASDDSDDQGSETDDAASETDQSDQDAEGQDAENDATTTQATTEPTAVPTSTPEAIAVPTSQPAPTRPPAPPAPRPTLPVVRACPLGQVAVGNICSCPAGQASRPGDGQCVRLCIQADLTMANTCVCTAPLYDNGGQCVKRCLSNEMADGFGGCKPATSNDTN